MEHTIDESSIGYLYGGDGNRCKIFFNVKFKKDNLTESSFQYYECDWNSQLSDENNWDSVYAFLNVTLEKYNELV